MNHFTNRAGFNAIDSQPDWVFKASTPPGQHPRGAYFTTLGPGESKLANRLRIPREKVAFYFAFDDDCMLLPLRGGRGVYIFYSPNDYTVPCRRQLTCGAAEQSS